MTDLYPEDLPHVIQGSPLPAFRGEEEKGEQLWCSFGCGQLLIDNYDADNYINVAIRCFGCNRITVTPPLPLGEVFCARPISLGETSRVLLMSTVNVPPGAILTCDQSIANEIKLTAPRDASLPLTLSDSGLDILVQRYDDIVGGKYELQRKVLEKSSTPMADVLPFAWAICHFRRCFAINRVDFTRSETITAVAWLQRFCTVVGSWEHHPRFRVVGKELGVQNSFLHTSSQLIAAAALFKVGNRIGISVEDKHGQPKPDLYFRSAGRSKVFLEVKAPRKLQWKPELSVGLHNLEQAVEQSVKDSIGQINKTHRGALIISSSFMSNQISGVLEEAIKKALRRRGRAHRSLAAVIGMSERPSVISNSQHTSSFQFSITLNEHFEGENPIVTEPTIV